MYIIKTIRGDITKITDVQAIVNTANNSLLGGSTDEGSQPLRYHEYGRGWTHR